MTRWSLVPLSEVCQIEPPKKEARGKLCDSDLVSFVPMNCLGICSKDFELNESKPLSEVIKSYTYFADEDVLLAKITPCFENGKLGIARGLTNGIGFGSSEYIVFRSLGKIIPEYLFYFLSQNSFREAGSKVMTGAVGHKRVPKDFIANCKIPVPQLPEQKSIVAILDKSFEGIDKAIANTEKNLASARELFASYLNKVFTQKGEGWEERPLERIASIINGFAFKSTDFSSNKEVKSIKITNVGVREFVCNSDSYLPADFAKKYSAVTIASGSIVIALTRTIISGGLKVAIVPEEYDGALLNQRVAAILTTPKFLISPFLFAFLSTKIVVDYVQDRVNTLMQPNLSINDLRSINVPLPTVSEQRRVSKMLSGLHDKTQRLESIYQQKLTALNDLKQSLLQKAFSGELTSDTVQ